MKTVPLPQFNAPSVCSSPTGQFWSKPGRPSAQAESRAAVTAWVPGKTAGESAAEAFPLPQSISGGLKSRSDRAGTFVVAVPQCVQIATAFARRQPVFVQWGSSLSGTSSLPFTSTRPCRAVGARECSQLVREASCSVRFFRQQLWHGRVPAERRPGGSRYDWLPSVPVS